MASFLPGYRSEIANEECRQRYGSKLALINNKDPYEIPVQEYEDDIDLWPATTYIHVGMYLVFNPSPYTGEDLLNYKSMECYQRLTAGWIPDIFVNSTDNKRIVIAKVLIAILDTF